MADPTLSASSPFAGLFLPSVDGLARVAEAPAMSRLSLRARGSSREALATALGLALPERINTAAETDARAALRLGPDEWLILAEPEAASSLLDAAARIERTVLHALVEISDRNAGLVLEGAGVEDILAAACPLPLDLDRFSVSRATRTLFGKSEIVLWRRAPDHFHVEVARSFGPYLVGLLGQIVRQEAALRRAQG